MATRRELRDDNDARDAGVGRKTLAKGKCKAEECTDELNENHCCVCTKFWRKCVCAGKTLCADAAGWCRKIDCRCQHVAKEDHCLRGACPKHFRGKTATVDGQTQQYCQNCNAFHPISCFPLQKSGERLKACKQRKPSSKGQGEGPAAWRKRARTPSPAGEREAPAGRSPGPRPRRTKQSATAQPGPSCESPAPHAAAAEQAAVDQGAAHAGAPLSPCASWGLGEADGFFCLAADPHAAGPDAWPAGEPHGYGEHDRGAEELLADDPFRAAPRERATGAAAPSAGDAHATGEPSVGSAGAWTSPTRASSLRELDDVLARLLEAAPSTTQAACGEGPGSWDARPACDAPFAGMHDGAGHAPAARPAATRAAAAENAYGAADSEYLTRIETTLQRCSAFDDGIPRSSPMPVEGILLFNY